MNGPSQDSSLLGEEKPLPYLPFFFLNGKKKEKKSLTYLPNSPSPDIPSWDTWDKNLISMSLIHIRHK